MLHLSLKRNLAHTTSGLHHQRETSWTNSLLFLAKPNNSFTIWTAFLNFLAHSAFSAHCKLLHSSSDFLLLIYVYPHFTSMNILLSLNNFALVVVVIVNCKVIKQMCRFLLVKPSRFPSTSPTVQPVPREHRFFQKVSHQWESHKSLFFSSLNTKRGYS